MSTCSECYTAELPECIDAFDVKNIGLAPNATINWTLTDKFENRLNGLIETDGDGNATLTDSSFNKMLRSFSGSFNLQFFAQNSKIPLDLEVCNFQTNCISISFYSESGESTPPVIGCVS